MDTADRNQGGLLKWHPMLAGKTAMPISHSPSPPCGTVGLTSSAMPNSTSPPADSTVTLGSEKNLNSAQTSRSIEITVDLVQELKQKSLSSPMKISGSQCEIHGGGTNTLEAGTVQGTRGLKAAGQREAQGQSQGQTSLMYAGANCSLATKGPSCRATANAYAKPFAS